MLGDVTLPIERSDPASQFSDTFNYIDISAVDNASKNLIGNLSKKTSEAPSRARQLVRPGDVLVSSVRPGLNAVALVPNDLPNAVASTGFCVLRPISEVLTPEYLFHFVTTESFVQILVSRQKGGAYPAVSDDDIRAVSIPLPPLSEQKEIVAILEEAKEIRSLRAQAEAKTAELIPAMFDASFGDPVRNPKKWATELLASVINDSPKNGLYKSAEFYGEGTPIIRIGDFSRGILRTSQNLQRLRITEQEIEQFMVANGQILINRVNSIEHLGKSLLVSSLEEPTVYESNMMRLDPQTEKVKPEFLIACLQHPSLVAKLRAKAKQAINQASINQTDVLTLMIPVPPISTQIAFVAQVEQTEAVRYLDEESLRLERALTASLSANAFSEKLTANWRDSNSKQLAHEARERDEALQIALTQTLQVVAHAVSPAKAIGVFISQERTDGIHSDLNREQRFVLREIKRMVGGVDYIRYFSAKILGDYIDKPPLRKNPQAIEGHLGILATLGLLILVSREEQTEDTGEYIYGNAYRLPRTESGNVLTYDGSPITMDGAALTMGSEPGDKSRLREMERLIGQLEKERMMK